MLKPIIHIKVKPIPAKSFVSVRHNQPIRARPIVRSVKLNKSQQRNTKPSRPVYNISKKSINTIKNKQIIEHKTRSIGRVGQTPRKTQPAIRSTATPPPHAAIINSISNIGVGKILVIIANGPSKTEIPLELLKGHDKIHTMVINKPDDRIWPTTYWTFCDDSQRRRHQTQFNSFNGYMFNTQSVKENKPNAVKIPSLSGKGFSLNLVKGLHIGRSSTYAGMQVAAWMNYDKIYVFGCDMTSVNGMIYPWGSNPDVNDQTRMKRFEHEAEHYTWAGNNLPQHIRDKFVFCSSYNPYEFTSKFNKWSHIGAVEKILEHSKTLKG